MFVMADETLNGQAVGRLPYPVVPGFERYAPDPLDMVREVALTVGDNCYFGNHAGSLDALFGGRAVSIDYDFESFEIYVGKELANEAMRWFGPGSGDAPLCPIRDLEITAIGRWTNPKSFEAVKIILPKDKIEALLRLDADAESAQGAPATSSDAWDFPVTPYVPGSYGGRGFYYDKNHLGEDERLAEGAAVHAIGPGKVVFYGPAPSYGELVAAVEHDLGAPCDLISGAGTPVKTANILSIYGHIRPCDKRENGICTGLSVGTGVTKDTIIGYVNDHNDDPTLDHNGDGKEHMHLGIRLASAEQAQQADGSKWLRGYESGSKTVGQFAAGSLVIPRLQTLCTKPSPQQEQLIATDGTWLIGLTGYGPLRIGMNRVEASAALGADVSYNSEQSENCFYAQVQTRNGTIGLLFQDQRLTEIEVPEESKNIITVQGVKIGDRIDRVDGAYRGQSGLERREHIDEGRERSVIYWDRGKKRGVRLRLDQAGVVLGISGGTSSIWDYESCD
jgi:murein DD-endopeptidase MepM/ murein hydrolase activator NlpD